ncbi:hypothetical protein [Williamsia herbipolensis]|uniref:hypothetical protein n=1 Tax=Williamsia herbipolensis TaxID=1603258 RepID=UPI0012379A12|nr:hypothetical protein [Williamsia herbipolensis]
MTELQLNEDEYRLFCLLPDNGCAAGNGSLRSSVGWSKTRYSRAQVGLVDKHLALRGVGRGGTLRRATVPDLHPDQKTKKVTIPGPVSEASLYAPLLTTLRADWSENRGLHVLATEETAFGGGRLTGGRWSRPDLVAVGLRRFELVPAHFELVTFEVKTVDHINVLAVYEALSHSRSATHAYAIFHVPDVLALTKEDEITAVMSAAAEHGIGVITFDDPLNFETWDEKLPAERLQSDPLRMNTFLQEQLSVQGQLDVAETTKSVNPDLG